MTALEAWRKRLDRETRFEGPTPAAAIKAAHCASGVASLSAFKTWLDGLGLRPFTTGKGYVLNIPHAPAHKLTAMAITADGKNTY